MPETREAMKLWNFAVKVPDLDEEVGFLQSLGAALVLDEILNVCETSIRVVLMRWADKYVHLFEKAVYESKLKEPLPYGICHVVLEVDDLPALRKQALDSGAHEVMPMEFVAAGFGTREVAFLRSPGGILFELIRVHKHEVPELP